MAKRFQTYFGVPIPPWKEKKLGAGSVTIRFVIKGFIPSKKNHQQGLCVRKDARKMIFSHFKTHSSMNMKQVLQALKLTYAKVGSNKQYLAFVQEQKPVLMQQMIFWSDRLRDRGLVFPLSSAAMSIRFYFKSKHIQDTVNKQQSVQDLLIEAGVVSNDDYRTLNPVVSASQCYFEEITDTIAFVSLSFRL